jgi:hypothetical protein
MGLPVKGTPDRFVEGGDSDITATDGTRPLTLAHPVTVVFEGCRRYWGGATKKRNYQYIVQFTQRQYA